MELGGSTALSPPRYSVDVLSCLLYSSVLRSVLSSLSHFNQKQAVYQSSSTRFRFSTSPCLHFSSS
ncbi:hypothetical protein ABWH52_11080, partial [Pasteurella multocida]